MTQKLENITKILWCTVDFILKPNKLLTNRVLKGWYVYVIILKTNPRYLYLYFESKLGLEIENNKTKRFFMKIVLRGSSSQNARLPVAFLKEHRHNMDCSYSLIKSSFPESIDTEKYKIFCGISFTKTQEYINLWHFIFILCIERWINF